MNRLSASQICLRLALLLLLAAAATALPLARGAAPCLRCGPTIAGTAADPFAAARVGLEPEWIVQLPFDSVGHDLRDVTVGPWMIVATSGDGGVHAVRASAGPLASWDPGSGKPQPGSLLWSQSIGNPDGRIEPPSFDGDLVVVARDLDLYALETITGQVRWHRRLPFAASNAGLPSAGWVYTPLRSQSMLRVPADPYRVPVDSGRSAEDDRPVEDGQATATASPGAAGKAAVSLAPVTITAGGMVEQPPQPFHGGVLWCSSDGEIVIIEPAKTGWERHSYRLERTPAGPVLLQDRSIFVATADGEFVRVDDQPGGLRQVWRVTLDAPLDPRDPLPRLFASEDIIIVGLGADGLAAYALDTGELRWRSHLAAQPLAIIGDRLWCLDAMNMLTAVSLADGQPEASLDPGPFTLPVPNRVSDRLVLASPRGLLVSLAPRLNPEAEPAPAAPRPGDPADTLR